MSDRQCPSCRERKDESEFWSGARRCRRCVAQETAERRSTRARQARQRIKEQHGLRVSISERRFKELSADALRGAEAAVPVTARDRTANAVDIALRGCGLGAFTALVPGPMLFDLLFTDGLVIAISLVAIAFGLGALHERLAGPRQRRVADLTGALLRHGLARTEAELLAYLRFYSTPEWRVTRETVIRRDGPICKACARHLVARDLTVDHIRPRSRFPELALNLENLQVLCRRCNATKGASVA